MIFPECQGPERWAGGKISSAAREICDDGRDVGGLFVEGSRVLLQSHKRLDQRKSPCVADNIAAVAVCSPRHEHTTRLSRRFGLPHEAGARPPCVRGAEPPTTRRGTPPGVSKQWPAIVAAGVGPIHHLNFSAQFCLDARTLIGTDSPGTRRPGRGFSRKESLLKGSRGCFQRFPRYFKGVFRRRGRTPQPF